MSVLSFVSGDAFTVRVVKHHTSNPDRKWTNTYELVANESGGLTDLQGAANALVLFETGIHYNPVIFEQVTVSTWVPDSVPYDPLAFYSQPLSGIGSLDPAPSQLEPLNVCLSIRKLVAAGRFGHNFYRGALTEDLVIAPAGIAVFEDAGFVQETVDAAITASTLDAYMVPPSAPLYLALIGDSIATNRGVSGLIVAGVSVLPLNHGWFNRTSPS